MTKGRSFAKWIPSTFRKVPDAHNGRSHEYGHDPFIRLFKGESCLFRALVYQINAKVLVEERCQNNILESIFANKNAS